MALKYKRKIDENTEKWPLGYKNPPFLIFADPLCTWKILFCDNYKAISIFNEINIISFMSHNNM